jgi:hypothetical protein
MRKKMVALAIGLSLTVLAEYYFFHRLDPYQTERFELTAGPAAAEGYPMEIMEGRFTTSDGKSIPFGAEVVEGDWGLSHSVVVVAVKAARPSIAKRSLPTRLAKFRLVRLSSLGAS